MAARKSNASKKLIPAARYLRYDLTNSGSVNTETSHFIDLARDISRVNRRLYRQGKDYHVKRVSVTSTNTLSGLYPGAAPGTAVQQNAGRFSVSTVPGNWVTYAAHKRAQKTWNEMNKTATKQIAGDVAGTWADFKVYMSLDSRSATLASPIDNGGAAYLAGMWTMSQLVTPDGTTGADPFDLHMLGDHSGAVGAWHSVGLIRSFGESRATVQGGDPNVPTLASDDPLVNVFDYGTAVDEVVDLLELSNDYPPYDVDEYPGDDTNGSKPAVVYETAISDGYAVMPGFTAFCGLLEIEISSPIASDVYSVLIELAPGKYRGIKAESI